MQGIDKFVVSDTEEARVSGKYPRPLNVIEGPLMQVCLKCHYAPFVLSSVSGTYSVTYMVFCDRA